eukprot:844625-Amphidinium_carterae.1
MSSNVRSEIPSRGPPPKNMRAVAHLTLPQREGSLLGSQHHVAPVHMDQPPETAVGSTKVASDPAKEIESLGGGAGGAPTSTPRGTIAELLTMGNEQVAKSARS